MQENNQIRTRSYPHCNNCGSVGTLLYKDLQDKLFGASGSWNMKRCNNRQCRSLWLDPMPIDEDIYKAYSSYYTHQNSSKPKSSIRKLGMTLRAGYQAHKYGFNVASTSVSSRCFGRLLGLFLPLREYLDFPFAYFKDIPKGTLLEIGCGSGDALYDFKDWGWRVEGLDFDAAAVANARAKQLNVHEGDLFSQHYEADSFDAVFSSHVLEHVPTPDLLLKESLRILKPGGRFVSVMPNAQSLQHAWFKSKWRGLEPPRHLHIFSPAALRNVAKQAGFKNVKVFTGNRIAAGIWLSSFRPLAQSTTDPSNHSVGARLMAESVHFLEYVICLFNSGKGEELILIATK